MSKKSAAKTSRDGELSVPSHRPPPAVIHVDLDGLTEVAGAWGWDVPAGPDLLFESGLRAALDMFAKNNVRATLFAVANSLDDPAKRSLIEEAVTAGHEIGSHTLSHPNLLTLTRAQKAHELGESRRILSRELKVEVDGFRAPGYRIDREGLEVLADTGYKWDSSGFPTPLFAERYGVSIEALERPTLHFDGLGLGELSLPDHRPSPVPFNPSYAILLGMPFFRWGVRRVARRGLPLVLLFHLIDFAAPLPRGSVPGLRGRVYTLSTHRQRTKLARCQTVIDELRRGFDICSTRELLTTLGEAPLG